MQFNDCMVVFFCHAAKFCQRDTSNAGWHSGVIPKNEEIEPISEIQSKERYQADRGKLS